MPYKDKSKDTPRLRKWRADNPERTREIDARNRNKRKAEGSYKSSKRSYYLKSAYGITLVDYERMYKRQRGVCAICGRPPKKGKLLFVDHEHKTNKVRGLLCHDCNIMIGNAGDSVTILALGISYLEEYK